MIRINLLPVRAARRRDAAARQLLVFSVGLVCLITAGVVMYLSDSNKLSDVLRANDVLRSDIEDLKKIIGEVDEYKAEERALAKKLGIIEDLRAKKTGPVRMLDRVASDIPDKLWLTELEEKEQKVTLKGVSINNEVIATFMSRLLEVPLLLLEILLPALLLKHPLLRRSHERDIEERRYYGINGERREELLQATQLA